MTTMNSMCQRWYAFPATVTANVGTRTMESKWTTMIRETCDWAIHSRRYARLRISGSWYHCFRTLTKHRLRLILCLQLVNRHILACRICRACCTVIVPVDLVDHYLRVLEFVFTGVGRNFHRHSSTIVWGACTFLVVSGKQIIPVIYSYLYRPSIEIYNNCPFRRRSKPKVRIALWTVWFVPLGHNAWNLQHCFVFPAIDISREYFPWRVPIRVIIANIINTRQ